MLWKLTAPAVLVIDGAPLSSTAPVYACPPDVVTSAASVAVPLTEKVVRPVIAPPTTALPVITRDELPPPSIVEAVVIVVPASVVSAARVTGSL